MIEGNIFPVILCGGSGTRLWPLSRMSFPKQFLNLNSESTKTLLQQTQERLKNSRNMLSPILICNSEHRFIVAEQMREINIKPSEIILEPIGKNTAPSIVLAALRALKTENNPTLLVLSSDHILDCDANFHKALNSAFDLARKGRIVTFGIIPKSANTGYGYIESKNKLNLNSLEGSDIKRFIEKPNLELAKKFILDKSYCWNSGMFVFKAKTIISEIQKFNPEILNYCNQAINTCKDDLEFKRINKEVFEKCPSVSIDVAIMERTKIGSVVPLNVNWTDIGNWKSLWEYEKKNKEGNVKQGKVFLKNVYDSFFKSSNKRLLVGMGLKDLIVVDTDDAILISNKNHSEEIKDLVNKLKENDFEEAFNHKKGFRPWGNYLSLASDKGWQVKLIEVNPGASLSLQKHQFRAEHWVVVKGKALVKIEDKVSILEENQSTFIPIDSKHQLSNIENVPLLIIEVQSGSYLGEDDIIRFEDKYGRK